MADTIFNKQSHSNGPHIGLYDISGTSTDTTGGNFVGGPYAEKVHQVPDDGAGNSLILAEGWDSNALVARKIKVDASGQIYIANAGTSSLGALTVQVVGTDGTSSNVGYGTNLSMPVSGAFTISTATVVQATGTNLHVVVDSGTFSTTPSGTQAVSGTISTIQVTSPWVIGGTTTAVPSGTQNVKVIGDVTSGTASNFLVTSTPSGTQTVAGAVTVSGTVTTTPSGTQAVSQTGSPWGISGTVTSLLSGTAAVTQVTSPWVVGGTTTSVPSGTQTIAGAVTVTGTVTNVPSGTQTVAGTVTSVLSGTAAVTQVTSPWVISGTVTPSGTQNVINIPPTTGGLAAPYTNINLGATGTAIKTSSGELYGYFLANTGTAICYAKFYNVTTAPTSTDTPVLTLPLGSGVAANWAATFGVPFSSGIGIRASGLVASTDTTALSSNQLIANIYYA